MNTDFDIDPVELLVYLWYRLCELGLDRQKTDLIHEWAIEVMALETLNQGATR